MPASQVGHAQGLFINAFGIFVVLMLAVSLRTNAVVVLALAILVLTFFFLGAGSCGGDSTLIHWGGYTGLAAAACAFYLALAEPCESSYSRAVSLSGLWPGADTRDHPKRAGHCRRA